MGDSQLKKIDEWLLGAGFLDLLEPRCRMVFGEHLREKYPLPEDETRLIELAVFDEDGIKALYNGRCVYHAKQAILRRLFDNDNWRRLDGMMKVAASRIANADNG